MLEPFEFTQIHNPVGQIGNLSYQGQAISPDGFVFGHDQYLVEEFVDGGDEGDNDVQEFVDG
ncbi:MAG: hypothetical protein JW963_15610 [Anaerolineales bacterium]|nr:hypothetical protein [Anaerolineales bacterium]